MNDKNNENQKSYAWLGRKKKKLVSDLKKNLGYEDIQKGSNYMKDMANIGLSPKERLKNSRKETFVEAKSRLGVSDNHLISVYRNYSIMVYISLFFILVNLFYLIYNIIAGSADWAVLMTSSVFIVLCLSFAFKYSFRSFQIKHQKLCAVSDWMSRPGEWMPDFDLKYKKEVNKTNKNTKLLK